MANGEVAPIGHIAVRCVQMGDPALEIALEAQKVEWPCGGWSAWRAAFVQRCRLEMSVQGSCMRAR